MGDDNKTCSGKQDSIPNTDDLERISTTEALGLLQQIYGQNILLDHGEKTDAVVFNKNSIQ